MKKHLCIDWGNTRLKAGFFVGEKLEKEYNFSHEEAVTQLVSLTTTIKPDAAIFCSVANHPAGLPEAISGHTQLIVLNSSTSLPFMNAYQSPETLGADRLALVAGAQALYPNETSLSISVGTAITYNFLQGGRIFRGGNITPGVSLRLRSLNEHTDRLPLVNQNGNDALLGYDTDAGIRAGVLWGIAAEIEGMLNFYQTQYSCFNSVLTGGDLPLFANKFKSRIFADSQILLKGLNLILNHNVR
ncbi:MAG TPA: type III pantothenate kinase [Edaphocola sp.]|nr:type III pantothenate kinase [Edaphocola sp.]